MAIEVYMCMCMLPTAESSGAAVTSDSDGETSPIKPELLVSGVYSAGIKWQDSSYGMVAQIRMSIVGIIHDRYVLVLQKKLKAMEKKGASKTKPTDSTKVRSDNRERLVRCYITSSRYVLRMF